MWCSASTRRNWIGCITVDRFIASRSILETFAKRQIGELSPAHQPRLERICEVGMMRQDPDGIAMLAAGSARNRPFEHPGGARGTAVVRHGNGGRLGYIALVIDHTVEELDLHIVG